jgi:DNA-binding Lrp family transcriptional regulator
MVKSNNNKIHLDEQKVIDALEQYSIDSIDKIAKCCGFSIQKVSRIIKNLERNKVIWGYPPITDGELGGLKHFVLLIKKSLIPFDAVIKKEMILEKIDAYAPNSVKVENILFTHGSFDVVVTFFALNLVNAKNFCGIAFKRLEKYIGEYILLETLVPMRKQGLKNPRIQELIEYV